MTRLTLLTCLITLTALPACTTQKKPDVDPGKFNRMNKAMVKAHVGAIVQNEMRIALNLPTSASIPLPKDKPCQIITTPSNDIQTLAFNKAGQIANYTSNKDGKPYHSVTLNYDAQGRVVSKILRGSIANIHIDYAYDTATGALVNRTHYSLDKTKVQLKVSYTYQPEKRTIVQTFWPDTPAKKRDTLIVFDDQWRVIKNSDAVWKHDTDLATHNTKVFSSEYSLTKGKLRRVTSTFTPLEPNKYIKPSTTTTLISYKNDRIDAMAQTTERAGQSTSSVNTYKYDCSAPTTPATKSTTPAATP